MDKPICDCGGAKAGTTHAAWCSVNGPQEASPAAFPPKTPALDAEVEMLKRQNTASSAADPCWYAGYDLLPDSASKELLGDLNQRMREWAEVRRAYRAAKRGQKK